MMCIDLMINILFLSILCLPCEGHGSSLKPDMTTNFSQRSLSFEKYPFSVINFRQDSKPQNPFSLDYHMTRFSYAYSDSKFSNQLPWTKTFDLFVHPCINAGHLTCVSTFHSNTNDVPNKKLLLVHVHIDFRHHRHFFNHILPFFESRYKETGKGIVLFSGNGDVSISASSSAIILEHKCVFYWRVEQNHLDSNHQDSRVMEIPVGIHSRQSFGESGEDLREILNITNRDERRYLRKLSTSTNENLLAESTPQIITISERFDQMYHRKLREAISLSATRPFHLRKDKIFVCFSNGYQRQRFLDWAKYNCTVCELCGTESNIHLPQAKLWEVYTEYKYIVSPHGNGFDCGRSWEILLLGAIPVIEHFAGVRGYSQANLSVISVKSAENLTEENVQLWSKQFKKSNDLYRLTREYWYKRAFTFENFTESI